MPPMSCPPSGSDPVSFLEGRIILRENDLSAGGFGQSWGHTRSYNNQLTDNADFGNGFNWLIAQWPYLVIDDVSVAVVRAGRNSLWFDEVDGAYLGRFGIKTTLTYDSGSDEFTVSSPGGATQIFAGLDSGSPGKLLRQITPGDSAIEMTYDGDRLVEMLRSVDVEGVSITEAYVYQYVTESENFGQIASVLLRRRIGDEPWSNIRRAVYTYYGASDSDGLINDLKTVTRELTEDGLTWQPLGTTYYRYYLDESDGRGFAHGLKFVVKPQNFFAISQAFGDPLTATDEQLSHFADNYFEFDSFRRVTREVTNGGTQTFNYQYSESSFTDGTNSWKFRTIETRNDGSQRIIYMNYAGVAMLDEIRAGENRWITYQLIDDATFRILQIAEPSAINFAITPVYDPAVADLAVQLKGSGGLIKLFEYYDGTDGGPANYLKRQSVKQGTSGTPIKQVELAYGSQSVGVSTVYPLTTQTKFRNDDGTGTISTTFDYDYYAGTLQVLEKTINFPVIPTDQNGSGLPTVRLEQYDEFGNRVWEQGPMGYIDHFSYDIVTGALIQQIEDVDPTKLALPSGWTRPSSLPPPLNLITDYEADQFGRTTQVLGPAHEVDGVGVRTAQWTVYRDALHEILSAQGFLSGSSTTPQATLVNPVSITRNNLANQPVDKIQAVRPPTTGRLSAADDFPQQAWTRWTHQIYDRAGRLVAQRVYSCIPRCGDGLATTNYDETDYGHDSMGRRNRTVTPNGTITRQVFDARDRTVSTWIGTNDDGATDVAPADHDIVENNTVIVTSRVYQDDCDCSGPSTMTEYIDADSANNRITTYLYDFRKRLTVVDGEINYYEQRFYDNLNNVIKVERRDTDAGGNLISQTESFYDDQNRLYRTKQYGVDPNTGTVDNSLTTDTWYDAAGKPIKEVAAGSLNGRTFTKRSFDSMGREYARYVGYYTGSLPEPYADVGSITASNKIFEQTLVTFDDAGNQTEINFYQRFQDATGNGTLNLPTGAQPKSRVSYRASWYDGIGRTTASVDFGTNDNAPFTRPATAPDRSNEVLVTSYCYDGAGNQNLAIDPAGRGTLQTFNAAGKPLSTISNLVPPSPPSSQCGEATEGACSPCSSPDSSNVNACPGDADNVTVRMAYDRDGNLKKLTACNPSTGDQVTQYEYGVTRATTLPEGLLFTFVFDDTYNLTYPIPSGVISTDHNTGGPTLLFSQFNKFGVDVSAAILAIPNGSIVTITDGVNTWPGGSLVAIGTGAVLETYFYSLHTNSSPEFLPQLNTFFADGATLAMIITPP